MITSAQALRGTLFLWLVMPFALHAATNFQSAFGAASVVTALDSAGNIYVAGSITQGTIAVTPGAFQQTFIASTCSYITGRPGTQPLPVACSHGFVAKIDPTGKRILWATYLEGELQDFVSAICVDNSGNVYVTGGTSSTKFPVTSNAWFQSLGTENFNGFIAKLAPDGTRLVFSTFLPGGTGGAIAVDSSQNVFVAGTALGATFPVTADAYQTQRFLGNTDAFVLKLNPSGSAPIYSTLIGGTFADVATALQIDSQGDAFVAGYTASVPAYSNLTTGSFSPFPSTPGALYQPVSGADVFISEVNPTGIALVYSSVFGGSGDDSIASIALDSSGAVIFTGYTFSFDDWPLTKHALRTAYGGGMAGKLSPDGSSLIYSTFLSGAGSGVVLDTDGNALLIGYAHLLDLATTPNAGITCGSSEFVMELNASGGAVYSSYLPSSAYAVSNGGNVYVQGQDAIFDVVNIFAEPIPGIQCVVNAANYMGNTVAPGEIVSISGPGIGPSQPSGAVLDGSGNVTSEIENTRVLIGGFAAPLLYVSSNQINAVVPFEIAGQTATTVQIEINGTVILPVFSLVVGTSAPGIFTLDATGYGQSAALNQDGSMNSASNPAAQGSIVSFFVTGVGDMHPRPVDGSVPKVPTAMPVLPLTMYIGGAPFPVQFQYAGDAPGMVEGAVQINAVVPILYQTGKVPVMLGAGGGELTQLTTIFVK